MAWVRCGLDVPEYHFGGSGVVAVVVVVVVVVVGGVGGGVLMFKNIFEPSKVRFTSIPYT